MCTICENHVSAEKWTNPQCREFEKRQLSTIRRLPQGVIHCAFHSVLIVLACNIGNMLFQLFNMLPQGFVVAYSPLDCLACMYDGAVITAAEM